MEQQIRKRYSQLFVPFCDQGLYDVARELADYIRRDQLVLFLGAGVSAAAGLPLWDKLLVSIAEDNGITQAQLKYAVALD